MAAPQSDDDVASPTTAKRSKETVKKSSSKVEPKKRRSIGGTRVPSKSKLQDDEDIRSVSSHSSSRSTSSRQKRGSSGGGQPAMRGRRASIVLPPSLPCAPLDVEDDGSIISMPPPSSNKLRNSSGRAQQRTIVLEDATTCSKTKTTTKEKRKIPGSPVPRRKKSVIVSSLSVSLHEETKTAKKNSKRMYRSSLSVSMHDAEPSRRQSQSDFKYPNSPITTKKGSVRKSFPASKRESAKRRSSYFVPPSLDSLCISRRAPKGMKQYLSEVPLDQLPLVRVRDIPPTTPSSRSGSSYDLRPVPPKRDYAGDDGSDDDSISDSSTCSFGCVDDIQPSPVTSASRFAAISPRTSRSPGTSRSPLSSRQIAKKTVGGIPTLAPLDRSSHHQRFLADGSEHSRSRIGCKSDSTPLLPSRYDYDDNDNDDDIIDDASFDFSQERSSSSIRSSLCQDDTLRSEDDIFEAIQEGDEYLEEKKENTKPEELTEAYNLSLSSFCADISEGDEENHDDSTSSSDNDESKMKKEEESKIDEIINDFTYWKSPLSATPKRRGSLIFNKDLITTECLPLFDRLDKHT